MCILMHDACLYSVHALKTHGSFEGQKVESSKIFDSKMESYSEAWQIYQGSLKINRGAKDRSLAPQNSFNKFYLELQGPILEIKAYRLCL